MIVDVKYVYKDYKYMIEVDYLEDNRKTYHLAIDSDGKAHMMPVSSYLHSKLDNQIFEMWIDMGMPDENKLGGKIAWHFRILHFVDKYDKWLEEEATKQLELALELEQE